MYGKVNGIETVVITVVISESGNLYLADRNPIMGSQVMTDTQTINRFRKGLQST